MFIELTDHLRCPADHEERYLVLLPDGVDRRTVLRGELGCPVCGRVYHVIDGIVDFGDAPTAEPSASPLDGASLGTLLGVSGPGGYLVLVGSAADDWVGLAEALPGIALVVVNPSRALSADSAGPTLSVVRAASLPLKTRSVRGVALGRGFGDDPRWVAEAARVVLPGLRVAGEGAPPEGPALDLLATASGWWVAAKSSASG